MINEILNGRKDEGLWIRPEVKVEEPQPTVLTQDIRVPESIAYARFIQLDCLRRLKKGVK